jgi:16S rRNA (guanine1207-N2)-methyltransferase
MNPPFHDGKRASPALGQAFIEAAAGMLRPKGRLLMVANRHLPYEESLAQRFRNVIDLGGDARFKLFCAEAPRRR